jgi:hypothetical protein
MQHAYECPHCRKIDVVDDDQISPSATPNHVEVTCPKCGKGATVNPAAHLLRGEEEMGGFWIGDGIMDYTRDLRALSTCQICGRVHARAMQCETCGVVFCPDHTTVIRGKSQSLSSHRMSVARDEEACPAGHPTIRLALPTMDLTTSYICEFSNRHYGSRDLWRHAPTCTVQNDAVVSRDVWLTCCIQGGGQCPAYKKAIRPWWKFW